MPLAGAQREGAGIIGCGLHQHHPGTAADHGRLVPNIPKQPNQKMLTTMMN